MQLVDWIDRDLDEVKKSHLFSEYFLGKEMEINDDRSFIENLDCGIDIILSKNLCVQTIHLYSEGYYNAHQFKGYIPNGVSFAMSRATVRQLLGLPKKTGGGGNNLYFGKVPVWDKYLFGKYSLHTQYNESENAITLITLASLKREAYFNIGLQ